MIRVLIVDDDKLARLGLLTMLPWGKYGMEVVGEAANGAKALAFLEKNDVDLVFVDLMMPVMSGLDLIREARAKHPELEVVVLTFHEDFSYVQSALRLGVLDYISKIELENADCEAICARMIAKFHSKESGDSEAANLPWFELLNTPRWIYDHVAFDELAVLMRRGPAPAGMLERLIVRAVVKLEHQLELEGPEVPALHTVDASIAYMAQFRAALMDAAQASVNANLPVCLMQAIQAVYKDLGGNLHTDGIAAKVGLSRPYFSSSFTKEVGLSFNAYVRRERVFAAQKLLLTTNESVAGIAAQVGYGDVRSFTKLFADHTGTSPAKYREGAGAIVTQK